MVLGFLSDLPHSEPYFNRSLPIILYTSNLEIIGNDPHPVTEDITRIMFSKHNRNPLETVATWRRLCQRWGISPSSAKLSSSCWMPSGRSCDGPKISGGDGEENDSNWRESIFYKRAAVEDLERIPKPAFWFWLFPLDAFGPMTADRLSPDYEAKPDINAENP
jgi:hypothetical protein